MTNATSTTVSAELRDRIAMLREHVEEFSIDLWRTLGSFAEVDALFDAETRHLSDDAQYDAMRASGYGDLEDLLSIVAETLVRLEVRQPSPEYLDRMRGEHPEWFDAEMVGTIVADVLSMPDNVSWALFSRSD